MVGCRLHLLGDLVGLGVRRIHHQRLRQNDRRVPAYDKDDSRPDRRCLGIGTLVPSSQARPSQD